jgi:hypothetical protein
VTARLRRPGGPPCDGQRNPRQWVSRKDTSTTMALGQSALLEVLEALKAAEVDDKIRLVAETICQALIEAELSSVIGAFPHQRTETRTAQRSGYRPRTLSTTAGDLELKVRRLRAGAFFPSLPERRRRVDQVAVRRHHGGLPARHLDPQRRRPGQGPGRRKPASPSPRSAGSAPTWTPSSPRSVAEAWPARGSRMCSWMPPTAWPGSTTGSTPRPPTRSAISTPTSRGRSTGTP